MHSKKDSTLWLVAMRYTISGINMVSGIASVRTHTITGFDFEMVSMTALKWVLIIICVGEFLKVAFAVDIQVFKCCYD